MLLSQISWPPSHISLDQTAGVSWQPSFQWRCSVVSQGMKTSTRTHLFKEKNAFKQRSILLIMPAAPHFCPWQTARWAVSFARGLKLFRCSPSLSSQAVNNAHSSVGFDVLASQNFPEHSTETRILKLNIFFLHPYLFFGFWVIRVGFGWHSM